MVIRNIHDTPTAPVEMDGVLGASMALMVGRDDGAPNFALRHFEIAPGGHTPRHAHDFEHEVFIVEGSGEVLLDGEYRAIRSGDVLYIPADHEHQFRADGEMTDATGSVGLRFLCLVPMSRTCGDPTPGS